MNQTISILIIIGIIAGIGAGMYFFSEKKAVEDEIEYTTISIATFQDNEMIKTGYEIYVDGIEKYNGTTKKNSYIGIQLPINKSVLIYNKDLEEQDFYYDSWKKQNINKKPYRVDLELKKPGKLNIEQEDYLFQRGDDIVELELSKKGEIKDLIYCIDWSTHVIYAEPINYTKHNGCYKHQNISKNIDLKYFTFGDWEDSDYINLTFYDLNTHPKTRKKEKIKLREISLI